MIFQSTIVAAAMLAAHPAVMENHRFEADPVATVHENFVACEVLSQLQASWRIPASCSPANASHCAQENGDHRFEADPVASVRENFVACEVLSQLQRVMENPRFLLAGECVPLPAEERVRVYASRGPYACIYPHDTIASCKWTHQKSIIEMRLDEQRNDAHVPDTT